MPKRKKTPRTRKTKTLDLVGQNRLLMDFMDHIPDVIYFKDTKGKLIFVNKAHADGLKLKPEQVIGKTDFDIFPKKKAAKMAKDDEYVIKKGKPIIDKIERATRADGVDNYVSTTKIPRHDAKGKVIGLMGITRDVTKRMRSEHLKEERMRIEKKIEMLEDLNQIKSEFISTVSHELRTPLAIIKQLLAVIFDEIAGPVTDKQRELLVRAQNNIERLCKLIDELLDISRLERKKLKLNYSLVNIKDLLKDSRDFFSKLAAEKNITLTYTLPQKEVNIFVDVERIIQVVTNLINNAIKFTGENGKVKVELKVLENKVRLGVIDSGVGMAKKDVAKIFDKFVQVSLHGEAGKKGIGLGLSIAKDIVEKHGGEIWAESKAGLGSKFYFTLPRFYTTNIFGNKIKSKIKPLLSKGIPVCLINLLIVDYKEFKKRVDVGPRKLSQDLKKLMEQVRKDYSRMSKKYFEIQITDMGKGKYNIVFPEASETKISKFFDLLRKNIKEYFIEHKVENVFIALGMMSYSVKPKIKGEGVPDNINVKEIYIGSEMRRAKRIDYDTDLEIATSDGASLKARMVDLSSLGICSISQARLNTDSKVKVKFMLRRKKQIFNAQARVAWLRKMDHAPGEIEDKYKIGLEFVSMGKESSKNLLDELKLYYE